jgi:hypothetical protein
LYVDAVAYFDIVYIASDDGIKPYGTAVAEGYVAYESCIFTEIAVFAPFGSETANGFYKSHRILSFGNLGVMLKCIETGETAFRLDE